MKNLITEQTFSIWRIIQYRKRCENVLWLTMLPFLSSDVILLVKTVGIRPNPTIHHKNPTLFDFDSHTYRVGNDWNIAISLKLEIGSAVQKKKYSFILTQNQFVNNIVSMDPSVWVVHSQPSTSRLNTISPYFGNYIFATHCSYLTVLVSTGINMYLILKFIWNNNTLSYFKGGGITQMKSSVSFILTLNLQ